MKGEMSKIQEGCVISLDIEKNLLMIMPRSGDGTRLKWRNGDDKYHVDFIESSLKSFYSLVDIIADTHGLVAVKDSFERSYGPAFVFVKE